MLLVGVAGLQSRQLNQIKQGSQNASAEEIQQQLERTQLNLSLWQEIPSLGFNNLLADWFFLQFLQYFGDDEVRNQTGYALSPEFFETIIPRDPYYIDFYLFLTGSTTLYAGLPERSVDLMARGLEFLRPEVPARSYLVWRYRGVDELLFLGDSAAAQQSFTTAASWALQSSDPDAPTMAALSQQTAQFLAANPDSKSAQISAWGSVLVNAFDDRTRRMAVERIQSLGGQVQISDNGAVSIDYPEED